MVGMLDGIDEKGVSHKQLVDLLQQEYNSTVYALSAKKWHWKMR